LICFAFVNTFNNMSFACAVGRQPQRGLSLLELLVAFAILALSLGLLYRSMGASARSVADMGYQQQAALLAESLLASRESVSVEGWNESGTREGFDFRVASAPYGQGLNRTMPAPAATATTSCANSRLMRRPSKPTTRPRAFSLGTWESTSQAIRR
jgi:general secretion pathway protein I